MKKTEKIEHTLKKYSEEEKVGVDRLLEEEARSYQGKIIVLDDDPTGVQTVHGIHVYTSWDLESIRQGFEEDNTVFFILTNSRAMSAEETSEVHRTIAQRIDFLANEYKRDYCIISRGDSTLRGHYPLETDILRKEFEEKRGLSMDGEILCPFFGEGGRLTADDVHYVRCGYELVPVGETEFAKDETFGFQSSNLKEYIEEKSQGEYSADRVDSITLEELRNIKIDTITDRLCGTGYFKKFIINAIDDYDVKVFAVALYRSLKKGRHFVIRCAASFIKAMGNVQSIPLLTRDEMIEKDGKEGGLIVVGSHTSKTTEQLRVLQSNSKIVFVELNSDLVLVPDELASEVDRVIIQAEQFISQGKTVCISTRRKLLKLTEDSPETALRRSVEISNALQRCVGELKVKPAFVLAKGGITSSDIGTKALRVKRAMVLGQVAAGVPVWKTDMESKFPGIPYVIFPGNVGDRETLYEVASRLMGDKE